MGTNYYARLAEPTCPHCNHTPEDLHIGKSSGGWCFALHVEVDDPVIPKDLDGWKALLAAGTYTIVDEYESPLTLAELLVVITGRGRMSYREASDACYAASRSGYGETYSPVEGLNGWCMRRDISDHCIGHGDGTWDLCKGTFC